MLQQETFLVTANLLRQVKFMHSANMSGYISNDIGTSIQNQHSIFKGEVANKGLFPPLILNDQISKIGHSYFSSLGTIWDALTVPSLFSESIEEEARLYDRIAPHMR